MVGVRREGRRYLVHYAASDASTDEWVGPDRMKVSGGPAPAPSPTAATPGPVPVDDTTPRPPARHHASADPHGDVGPDEVIPQVDADLGGPWTWPSRPNRSPPGA